jgi:hypothetical protein
MGQQDFRRLDHFIRGCCLREFDLTFATINLSLCTLLGKAREWRS